MKTDSMNKFDYCYLGGLIVQLFVIIVGWDTAMADVNQAVQAEGGGQELLTFLENFILIGIVVVFVISLIISALISVARLGFVRYIFAVLVVLSGLSLVGDLVSPVASTLVVISSVVVFAMNCAAVFFVFQPDAGSWLRREV